MAAGVVKRGGASVEVGFHGGVCRFVYVRGFTGSVAPQFLKSIEWEWPM